MYASRRVDAAWTTAACTRPAPRALHPVRPDLAEEVAVATETTLDKLGLRPAVAAGPLRAAPSSCTRGPRKSVVPWGAMHTSTPGLSGDQLAKRRNDVVDVEDSAFAPASPRTAVSDVSATCWLPFAQLREQVVAYNRATRSPGRGHDHVDRGHFGLLPALRSSKRRTVLGPFGDPRQGGRARSVSCPLCKQAVTCSGALGGTSCRRSRFGP
jgi:hypothetical protein